MYELWKWLDYRHLDDYQGEWSLVSQYSTFREAMRSAREYKRRGECIRISEGGKTMLLNGDVLDLQPLARRNDNEAGRGTNLFQPR